MGLLAALAALSWGADAALTSRRPFSLEGARRRICLLMALGVNLWTAAALLPDPSPVRACSWFFLANGLFLTAVTDLLEQVQMPLPLWNWMPELSVLCIMAGLFCLTFGMKTEQ